MYVQLAAQKLHGIQSLISSNQQSSLASQSEQQSSAANYAAQLEHSRISQQSSTQGQSNFNKVYRPLSSQSGEP